MSNRRSRHASESDQPPPNPIAFFPGSNENESMNITYNKPAPPISAESQAVLDLLSTGKALDPAVAKRIHEKARKIRERVFKEHGLVDIAVPAIREFRGELPEV